jgi:hypothetical protein
VKQDSGMIVALVLAGIVGCGGSDFGDRMADACIKDGDMTQEQCRCFADRAEKDLSRNAQEMIVAQIEENDARVNELSRQMSVEDASKVGEFLINAGTQCTGMADPQQD